MPTSDGVRSGPLLRRTVVVESAEKQTVRRSTNYAGVWRMGS